MLRGCKKSTNASNLPSGLFGSTAKFFFYTKAYFSETGWIEAVTGFGFVILKLLTADLTLLVSSKSP